ncbi:DNA repair endonuclease XPF isoform X2 [Eurytemora carolleeae]|uniref:DNA repair endonuclease XPF isoform X1 n=1 Tax=Eurytemora carolleeae TaxID=1294199 RepID=UPI000C776508|nr:DNA repair endonuclease XPF isoform X1 [Eurytemora carolleeae]XP_023330559.1 DNA repair endonuclease XPF isoform X2 [Eurytemora carolleeae]|eukprot:XP_023330558.1 DNA repair endonuclease XPF-like isoform X1 [Eurytemora affinis]
MKNLFIKNLHLWPRFHKTVSNSLSMCQPEVVELHLEMTDKMKLIQTAVLDLISFTVKEIKRLNPHLSTEQLTVENTISKSFHKILQQELNPIWHQLSGKTKQLISDLKTMRSLMVYLTQYDCITFYSLIAAQRTAESALKSSSGWVTLDSAESLFLTSKDRVFSALEETTAKKSKPEKAHGIEENPKWNIISEILGEIRDEMKEFAISESAETVLIITKDERTSNQVRDYLELGSSKLLARMYNKALGEKHGFLPDDEIKPREPKNKGIGKSSVKSVPPVNVQMEIKDLGVKTVVHGLESRPHLENWNLLEETSPRFIILYDADVSFVRQIECFQANNPNLKIRVYFLMYKGSVEEQAYLTVLRREKEAFEKLISEKSGMVIPEDREGRTVDNETLSRNSKKASDILMESQNSRSRKGGAINQIVSAKVIVDMREFRSELPSLLHKRGIDIDPVTLEVGDYILTPEICVERKSISDLIGSLGCGRLYNQATAMTRFYNSPMLLIEFDDKKPFSLQGKYYLSKDLQSSDIVAKLQLLTLHFPKLRILWSPSPHATAELFDELKQGREQPDSSKAATIGVDIIDDINVDKYNPQIQDFLSKLPGISSKNIYAIMNHCENLLDLLEISEEELSNILGSQNSGSQLYQALHSDIEVPQLETKPEKKPVFKSKFKSRKVTK